MKLSRVFMGAALVVLFAGTGLLFSSCASLNRTVLAPPAVPGATFVGNQACADCHAAIVQHFPGSPHARIHLDAAAMPGSTGCESCHGPGSKHIQSGGARGQFIVNPGKDPAACFQCHLNTHAEFQLPHRHPVIEGRMNCAQCHDPHGSDILKPAGGLLMARLNESCAQCHRDQARPFVFEHEAMREGCATCHQPHGSINRKMLVQRDANLCLRCHAQAHDPALAGRVFIGSSDHTQYLNRATCWGCHNALHGSNVDTFLRY